MVLKLEVSQHLWITNTFANEVTITAGGFVPMVDVAGITTLSSTLSVAAGGISVVSGGSSIIGVVTSFEGDGSNNFPQVVMPMISPHLSSLNNKGKQ